LAALVVSRALEPVQGQKARRRGAAVTVDSVEVARAGEAVLPLHRLRAEALAALRAAALDDQAARARRHPGAEAVLALPPAHVWLIGPFHALERVKSARGSRGAEEYRRIVSALVVHSRRQRQKAWNRRSRDSSHTALSTDVE